MAKNTDLKLDFVREDDFVEYFLFPLLPEDLREHENSDAGNEEQLDKLRNYLNTVLKQCNDIVQQQIEATNYIWHKDGFNLQIRTSSAQERLMCDDLKAGAENLLPPHLHGVSHYGDNISDEWFIVHLLHALSSSVSGLIARVVDSDGEFMLIEAADFLPDWANPDTCEQRLYIVDGSLHLVQNSPSNTTSLLPVAKAIAKLREHPTLYRVSSDIQKAISARLKEFQQPNTNLFHRQIVRLPLAAAAILKQRPDMIAHAVRAFCDRDAIDMKACRSMRFFPPEQQRVRTCVRFTRCLYAMIMSSNYTPDRRIGWNLGSTSDTETYKEDLLGVKIACGLEILTSQAKESEGNKEQNPAWRTFLRSLSSKGYFRGNLEGSAEYKRLLEEAKGFFDESNSGFRTAAKVGSEILALLNNIDTNVSEHLRDEQNNLEPSDPDDWLNITPEQLDAMLLERYGPKKLFKGNGDINAEEFTKNLADFLEKESGFDGIDSDDFTEPDDEEDDDDAAAATAGNVENAGSHPKSHRQRKDEFKAKVKKNHSMRKACNRNSVIVNSTKQEKAKSTKVNDGPSRSEPPEQSSSTNVRDFLEFVIPEDNWESNSEMSEYEDEDDLERHIEAMTNPDMMNMDLDIQTYMRQMDQELARTTIGQSFERKKTESKNSTCADDSFDDIESFEPININVNTLKNMMDSYKSQIGGTGPVSHLLSAMGVGMSAAAAAAANAENDDEQLKESTV